jgi:hypothetical protein
MVSCIVSEPSFWPQVYPENGDKIFLRNLSRAYTFVKPQVMISHNTNINTHSLVTLSSHTTIIVLTKASQKFGMQSFLPPFLLYAFPINSFCISL